jgi:hypothetical protein
MKKNVLKSVIALAALTFGSQALADGFSASLGTTLYPGSPSFFSVGGSLGYSLKVLPLLTINGGLSVNYLSASTGASLSYLSAGIGAEYLFGLSQTADLKIDLPVGADVFLIAPVSNSQNVNPVTSGIGADIYAGIDVQYLTSQSLKVSGAGQFSVNFGSNTSVGFGLSGAVGLNYYPTESLQVYGGLSLYSNLSSTFSYGLNGGVNYLVANPIQLYANVGLSNSGYALGTGLFYSFTPSLGLGLSLGYSNSFTSPSTNANFSIGLQLSFIENPKPRVTFAQFRP